MTFSTPPLFQLRFRWMCILIHHLVQWNEWSHERSALPSRLLDRKNEGENSPANSLSMALAGNKAAARGKRSKGRCGIITGTLSYIKYQNRCVCTLVEWRHSVSISTASSTSFILQLLIYYSDGIACLLSVYLWNAELVSSLRISIRECSSLNWFGSRSQWLRSLRHEMSSLA